MIKTATKLFSTAFCDVRFYMDIFLPCDLTQLSISQELPVDSGLTIEESDSDQVIQLSGEGLRFGTLVGMVLGGLLATLSFLAVCFVVVMMFFKTSFELHHCLFLLVVVFSLVAWGITIVAQSVQRAYCQTKLTISDGMLSIEQIGPMSEDTRRIWLDEIVETGVWPKDCCGEALAGMLLPSLSRKHVLWIRLPSLGGKPFNKLVENKDCRRSSLLSYGMMLAARRRPEELRFLEQWIDINIAAIKSNPSRI